MPYLQMKLINELFYYFALYLPLLYWVLFMFFQPVKELSKKLIHLADKKIAMNSEHYSFQKFLFLTLAVTIIFYLSVGAIGALFQTLIGFKELYDFEDNDFIFKVLASAFEFLIFISMLTFLGMTEYMQTEFSFLKKICNSKKYPRAYIQNLYIKHFGWHILCALLLLNIYYFVVGEFFMLDGGKYLTVIYWL